MGGDCVNVYILLSFKSSNKIERFIKGYLHHLTWEFQMKYELRLLQTQRQELNLQQIIEFNNLLAVPDEVLNAVARALEYTPDSIEEVLQSRKRDASSCPIETADKIQTIYSSLIQSKGGDSNRSKGGLIISPDLRVLEDRLALHPTSITSDVTYIGRRDEKPEIVFSDHLKGAMSLRMLQVDPSSYPETSKLLAKLKYLDEWKRRILRDAYTILGGFQREFLEEFDRTRYNLFRQEDLADRLNISPSTVSRILSNRWVEARNVAGDQKFMYAKDFCVTQDEIRRYEILPPLNNILREEFERKKAYSDREISEKTGGKIGRRTITKYRTISCIPNNLERTAVYKSGEKAEPYRFL